MACIQPGSCNRLDLELAGTRWSVDRSTVVAAVEVGEPEFELTNADGLEAIKPRGVRAEKAGAGIEVLVSTEIGIGETEEM